MQPLAGRVPRATGGREARMEKALRRATLPAWVAPVLLAASAALAPLQRDRPPAEGGMAVAPALDLPATGRTM